MMKRPARALRLLLLPLALQLAERAPPSQASPGPSDSPASDTFAVRPRLDGRRMLADLHALAHDSMEGRRTGTQGGERARRFLVGALEERGVPPLAGVRAQSFDFAGRRDTPRVQGANVLGVVPGTVHPERYLVVSAHYDHLGIRNGEVFNGADDNASGSAALLALAAWFRSHPARHSVLFVAFDAEEQGLQGSRAFVRAGSVPLQRIVLNVNLDMVGRSEAGELYAVGTYHRPFLTPLVEEAARASKIRLLRGHEGPGVPPGDDWTLQSDHGAFHEAGVPFLYFGVEDHPGYHRPGDDAEHIPPAFYVEAVETVLDVLLLADRSGEAILESRRASGG